MRLTRLTALSLILTLSLFAAVSFGNQDNLEPTAPSVYFPETTYEFAPVLDGAKVVHEFVIQNKGNAPLKVNRVKTG